MIIKDKIILNSICILFVAISIFLLIVSEEPRTRFIAVLCLLLFGGGNIASNILESEKSGSLVKNAAGIIGSLIFVIVCYYFLPFHHLFDGARRYTPTLGWVIGIAGILFFGIGFIKLTKNLFKGKHNKKK